MLYNIVINKITGDTSRAGFCDFENQGNFDSANTIMITPGMYPIKVKHQEFESSFHRYDFDTSTLSLIPD